MKKISYIRSICTAFVLFLSIQHLACAIELPAGADASSINVHDMDLIKQRQLINKETQDFQTFQDRKKKEKTNDKNKSEAIENFPGVPSEPIIRAKVTEYQSKGVFVDKIEFSPSQIFSEEELNAYAKELEGKNVFIGDIQAVVDEINYNYALKGFVTARAFLTEQTIDNGTIKITLVEGKTGQISIVDNRWTKDSYIQKRIQEEPGNVFDIVRLEQDIIKFNRYNQGVKLKADLRPGEVDETTDINIKTEEEFPYRLSAFYDNAGRTTIGKQRAGLMMQADSLFGYRDTLTTGAYLSRSSVTPFVNYSIPVNKYDGRVGFTYSSSFAEITSGDFSMFHIKSRSQNYALYYMHPLVRTPRFELTGIAAANYKQATTSFDNVDLYTDKVTSTQGSINAKYDSKRGIWYLTQSVYQAFPIFSDASHYFKYEGALIRLHDFGHGIVGQFRTNYQFIPEKVVPYIDQFQSGGLATVRGYSEGLLIGKSGYFLSGELMFPIAPSTIKVKDKKTKEEKRIPFIGKYVKGAVFMDQATVFPFKGEGPGKEGYNANDMLLSGGLGLRAELPGDLTARVYWGFPFIRNSHEAVQQSGRFHFELSLTPDFYKLVQWKIAKDKVKIEKEEIKEKL